MHLEHSSPTGTSWRRDDQGRNTWVLRRRDASLHPVSATRILDDLDHDADVLESPTHGWRDFLQRLAHGLRRAALARPEAVPGLLAGPPAGSPLLPPLTSTAWADRFLAAMTTEGFSDEQAVGAYRAFTTFLAGHLWVEVSAGGPLSGRTTVAGPGLTSPALRRLADLWDEPASADEFAAALQQLLDRLEAMRAPDLLRAEPRHASQAKRLSVAT